jgi:hypothetical protein
VNGCGEDYNGGNIGSFFMTSMDNEAVELYVNV